MAINVTERINIDCPAETIAEFMFDPQNDMQWLGGVIEVKNVSTSIIEVGTEIHRIAHFLGKDIDYILVVKKIIKGKLLSTESTKSPFPMKVDYLVEDVEGKQSEEGLPYSVVSIKIEGQSKGYLMFVDRLLALMVSHNVKGDLMKLKQILEKTEEQDTY